MNSNGLDNETIIRIKNVFSCYPEVDKVILYGSRAKGNFKPGSDIDMTILGDKPDNDLLNKIWLQLYDLYLPYTFDMSLYKHISDPDFIGHINRVGIIFYSKNRNTGNST